MDNQAAIEQPAPQPGQQVVLPEVIRYVEYMASWSLVPDLTARAEQGRERYSTYLMTHNGRDSVMDCYQEVLDGLMYIMQAMLESSEEQVHQLSRIRLYLLMSAQWLKDYLVERESALPPNGSVVK